LKQREAIKRPKLHAEMVYENGKANAIPWTHAGINNTVEFEFGFTATVDLHGFGRMDYTVYLEQTHFHRVAEDLQPL